MWKYLHLPPLEGMAGRSSQMFPLFEVDKKSQKNKARVTRNNKPRPRRFRSTVRCLQRLKERHFFGILLPLPVTELTRKRALAKQLALLCSGKQVALLNFSPGLYGLTVYVKNWEKSRRQRRAKEKEKVSRVQAARVSQTRLHGVQEMRTQRTSHDDL